MRRLITFVALVLVIFGCTPRQSTRNARPAPTIDTTIAPRLPLFVNRVGPVDTIIGVVSDARTSAGVEEARVMDVGAQRFVMTDKLGRFVLPTRGPGKTVLQTTGTGYRARLDTVDVVTRQGLSLGIPMRPDAVRLAYACACPMVIFLQVDVRSSVPKTPIPWAIVTVTEKDKPARRDSVPGGAFTDSVARAVRINVGGTPASQVTVEVSAPGFRTFRTQVKELPHTVTAVLQPTT
jgi:hypothetical protein